MSLGNPLGDVFMQFAIIHNERAHACQIDQEDYDYIKQWNWYLAAQYDKNDPNYRDDAFWIVRTRTVAERKASGLPIRQHLHRLIAERMFGQLDSRDLVDHINRDRSDMRRSNLRLVTVSQNRVNAKLPRTNTSGFKGVNRIERKTKTVWVAVICLAGGDKPWGQRVFCGQFDDPISAAESYDEKMTELFGEYACTNKKLGLLK